MSTHAQGIEIAQQLGAAAGLSAAQLHQVAAEHLLERREEYGLGDDDDLGWSDVRIHLSAMARFNRDELEERIARAAAVNNLGEKIDAAAAELGIKPADLRQQLAELLR